MTGSNGKIELREYFDQAGIGFVLYDDNLDIVDVNRQALSPFNISVYEALDKNICEVFPGIENSNRFDIINQVRKTGIPVEHDIETHHELLGHLHHHIRVFKSGNDTGEIITNITELKDTIDELNTFVYKSSHDMRSPIANMLGLISFIRSNPEDSKLKRSYIELMEQEVKRLDNVLSEINEAALIRKGDTVVKELDFNYIIPLIYNSFSLVEGFNQIRFESEIAYEQIFFSDRHIVSTIIHNIFENSFKFRKKESNDSILSIHLSESFGLLKIVISDNGIGIDPKYHSKIFSMFFRANHHSDGVGLGLYTVKNCVKKLKGNIQFSSVLNEGTTFTIYLPNEGQSFSGN